MSLFEDTTSQIGTIANRLLGRAVTAPWIEDRWLELKGLATQIAPYLKRIGIGRLHNQDLQNALCEWDRYEKLWRGGGTARRYFHKG